MKLRAALPTVLAALRLLTGLAVLLTPAFWLAGIMGFGRSGDRGPYFVLEQAFYWSTLLYPLLWIACTAIAAYAEKRRHLSGTCFIQSMPFIVPVVLFFAAAVTAR